MPAAFRLYPKFQTFFSDDGTLLAGGYLKFFAAGTVTAKNVYGEKALSTNNGSRIDLDAAGRPEHPIWGSGQYDVELYDADDEKVGEDLLVEVSGGEATALPALSADKFLTNDGSVMSWATVRQVPNPSGHSGDYLSNDGTTLTWVAGPATPETPTSPATVDPGKVIIGTTGSDFAMILSASATATAAGSRTCSKAVTYSTAFNATPKLTITPTGSAPTNGSDILPGWTVTASSATGFTVEFSTMTGGTSADSSNSNSVIANDIDFDYIAIGTVDEPA